MKDRDSALGNVAGVIGWMAVRIIIICLMVLVTIIGVKYCYEFGHEVFYQGPSEPAPGRDMSFEIKEGEGISAVSKQLKEEGLISNEKAFEIQGKLYKLKVYPGTYNLNTSMTSRQILDTLNITEDEYNERVKESTAAESDGGTDVYGEGSDMVDEDQAKAAAAEGITVETEFSGE